MRGAGVDVTQSFSAANGNLIFCRRENPLPDTIWIRLAESRTADGENSPHIDIDLCHFTGSATYQTVHEVGGPLTCSNGATFAIWWHDGPSQVFVSRPESAPCSVSVTRTSDAIEGSFACLGLTSETGTDASVDVVDGSFRCSF